MNKKMNLFLVAILFGGLITFLSAPVKLAILASTIVVLFMRYDFYDYDLQNGGIEHEKK